MYIIALLFGTDKTDDDFKIVAKKATVDKLYTINYPYPTKSSLADKQAWYEKFKNVAKFYKNQGSAISLIRKLEKEYNITGYKIIELEQDVIEQVFNGCPNCGSFDVIEKFSTQYNRVLKFDLKTNTSKEISEAEDTGFGTIDGYECQNCGTNLSKYKFNHFKLN